MKFLTELNEQHIETLVENTMQGKKYYIEGRWATANEKNRNGRIYPGQVMESALNKYQADYISQRRALGELNHPASGPSINLDRASHLIENLKMEGNYVTGRAKIMGTPMGEIAKSLIDEGVKLGVSTRGLGSVEQREGCSYVKNDFFISAIDIVSDPSGGGCWMQGIQENAEWILKNGEWMQITVDAARNKINEETAIKEFSRLFMKLAEGKDSAHIVELGDLRSHGQAYDLSQTDARIHNGTVAMYRHNGKAHGFVHVLPWPCEHPAHPETGVLHRPDNSDAGKKIVNDEYKASFETLDRELRRRNSQK